MGAAEHGPQAQMRKATHGMGCNWTGSDAVSREAELYRVEGDIYLLVLRTHWEGDGSPPLETRVAIGREALEVVAQMIGVARTDIERFRIQQPPQPGDSGRGDGGGRPNVAIKPRR